MPQVYLTAEVKKKYYRPKGTGYEKNIEQYLQKLATLLESWENRENEGKG